MTRAHEGWQRAWEIVHTDLKDGWHREAGKDLLTGCVYSRHFNDVGKVFRLEVCTVHPLLRDHTSVLTSNLHHNAAS